MDTSVLSVTRNQHDQGGGLVVYGYNRSPSAASTARNEGYDVSNDLIETLQRAEINKALIILATPAKIGRASCRERV